MSVHNIADVVSPFVRHLHYQHIIVRHVVVVYLMHFASAPLGAM
jgi:hypothetical protein